MCVGVCVCFTVLFLSVYHSVSVWVVTKIIPLFSPFSYLFTLYIYNYNSSDFSFSFFYCFAIQLICLFLLSLSLGSFIHLTPF